MKRLAILLICLLPLVACSEGTPKGETKSISLTELENKIAGAWIGQMVGNIYGLEYENDFVDEHGEGPFTFAKSMTKMEAVDGAFSDDDTDVEYLYLTMMEKNGVSPTYAQMTEGWMHHIRDRVWLANRATLGLMHYGLTPPFTGDLNYNPHWFQIDPQLINEIWAYTAPGMLGYAAGISDWAARITSDSWATSPTVHYGVMYSMAFFEKDIRTLVETAATYLPEGDRYRTIIKECCDLYDANPDDWRPARKAIADKYWFNEDPVTKTIWNADLNGAMGVLSMLYGKGDIEETLYIGCALGFDADNQTATVCGILGTMYGAEAVPANLSMPFPHWTKPFNNRYINVTRYDLPDETIEGLIKRTVDITIKVVLENGGQLVEKDGEKYLVINTAAEFKAPMEFCEGPMPKIVAGEPVDYAFYCDANKDYTWKMVDGKLPAGLKFKNGRLTGTAATPGQYNITLSLSNGKETIRKEFDIVVRGKNIAPEAAEIVASVKECNFEVLNKCWTTNSSWYYADNVNVINDGKVNGEKSVFYSLAEASLAPRQDYFGYIWDTPRTVNMVSFHFGCLEEFGGWYSDMWVEYLNENGEWVKLISKVTPKRPETDVVFIQPHFVEYLFQFAPVTTKGIRVKGNDKVEVHWDKYTKNVSSFISVTEVSVYEYDENEVDDSEYVELSKADLMNKIKGGWAGQTIGVVYGAPTEFKFTGTTIQDYQPIPWSDGYVKYWWDKKPGLFDDIYNDLTFVEAFEELGLDCTAEELGMRFAYADYHLAHANQAGRYNIKRGILPPASGHWMNNPHADDLDFQIEADFIGLMAPAMIPEAMDIAETVGHIMNSGDGFYGGAFVAGLYSAAFKSNDPAEILDIALSTIPEKSTFYQCVDDVRKLHKQYPNDWEAAWFEMHKKWNKDVGCPKGVFLSFNIDAKINAAYIAMGMLYGEGDFTKSMDISTRCGQDSDCNPASVGGVLGVVCGYDGIPEFWLNPLKEIWDLDFQGTTVSLAEGAEYSYSQALELIAANGGKVLDDKVLIRQSIVEKLPFEQNFINTYPLFRERHDAWLRDVYEFDFKGNGFVIWGNMVCLDGVSEAYAHSVSMRHIGSEVFGLAELNDPYVAEVEVWIDGRLDTVAMMPMKNTDRRLEPAWKYQMTEGEHHVKLVWKNPNKRYLIRINDVMYYSENQNTNMFYHN